MSENPYAIECAEWRRSNPDGWDAQLSLRIKRTVLRHIHEGPARELLALSMVHVDSVMRGNWGIYDMNGRAYKAWQEWMERRAKLRECNKSVNGKTQIDTPA